MQITRRDAFFILFSIVLFGALWGPLRGLIDYASDWENKNASQVILIPFISAYLIFQERKKIFAKVEYSVAPAIALGVIGVGFLVLSRSEWSAGLDIGDQLAFSTAAMVSLWLCGFLFSYGTQACKVAVFPLLFLILAIPIPSPIMDRTIAILQHASASVSFAMIKLSGTPILRTDDVFFTMPNITIEVAPQCSGIRSGISLFILSILAGHMLLDTWWRRGALMLAAIPILIFKNALRISVLSLLAVYVDTRILTSRLHKEGGIPFFVVGLLLIYPILSLLMKSERRNGGQPATQEVNP